MEAPKKESSSLRNQGSHSGEGRPLAEGRLTVLPQELCEGDFKGGVRLFNSEPPHEWTGRSLAFEVAKRLLQEGKAQLLRKSKGRIRGVFLKTCEPERRRYRLRGSLGQPKRSGASWTPAVLPHWAPPVVFTQVINSCRTMKSCGGDEIVGASQSGVQADRQAPMPEFPKGRAA